MNMLWSWYNDTPFSTATWIDWLDILLLSWLIYRVLLVIRGTRAMQILLGVTLLATVWVVSDWVGLAALRWLLDNVFVYALLGVIILFQEDIRRALARAGGTFFGRNKTISDANLLEEVIQASFALSQRRIGGIIAIERGASLVPYTEGARWIEGQVSDELIQSIFHPSSPIHDGAIVVSGNRLLAAGVFFPISLSANVAKMYGTRHRAAIGLTEDVDAICLVISEERGTVSLVLAGQVIPVADANDLRQRLQEGLESESEEQAISTSAAPA